MIDYVTGSLGMGKSAYAVRSMARAFISGRAVAGNIQLVDDWAYRVAKHNPYTFGRPKFRAELAKDIENRYHYADTLEELTWVKLHGRGESRGVLVLDEAHNELNNRDWQSLDSRVFLKWLSLLRKKGWRSLLISQHADNTDAGGRRICQTEVKMVNWKKVAKLPVFGAEFLPVPLFLALHFPTNLPPQVANKARPNRRELFPLGWWKKLYETHELFGEDFVELPDDPTTWGLWLPSSPEERRRRAEARAAATAVARAAIDEEKQTVRRLRSSSHRSGGR